jgi:hypothetical protein
MTLSTTIPPERSSRALLTVSRAQTAVIVTEPLILEEPGDRVRSRAYERTSKFSPVAETLEGRSPRFPARAASPQADPSVPAFSRNWANTGVVSNMRVRRKGFIP